MIVFKYYLSIRYHFNGKYLGFNSIILKDQVKIPLKTVVKLLLISYNN